MSTLRIVIARAAVWLPALRAQSTSTALLRALASPSHENPPIVNSQNFGKAWIEMRLEHDGTGTLTRALWIFGSATILPRLRWCGHFTFTAARLG